MNALKDNPTVLALGILTGIVTLLICRLPVPNELWAAFGGAVLGSGASATARNVSKPPPGYTNVPTKYVTGAINPDDSTVITIPPPGGLPK